MKETVVFVTVDSLRYDRISAYGYSKPLTPFLDTLIRESTHFTNFYANSIPTFFAFPVIFTSLPPFWRGNKLGISRGDSWIREMKMKGYETCALIADNFALHSVFNYDDAFDSYELIGSRSSHPRSKRLGLFQRFKNASKKAIGNEAWKKLSLLKQSLSIRRSNNYHYDNIMSTSAEHVIRKAVSVLRENEVEKLFIWIHLMDVHYPYFPGVPLFNEVNDYKINRDDLIEVPLIYYNIASKFNFELSRELDQREKQVLVHTSDLYDSALRYVDSQIEKLFSEVLKRDGRKIVLLTSDHGEAFGEKRKMSHEPFSLYNEVLRVPLIIFDSAVGIETRKEGLFSHKEIGPMLRTVINFETLSKGSDHIVSEIPYGAKAPHYRIRDSYSTFGDYPSSYSVIFEDGVKVILNHDKTSECYDLKKYPAEQIRLTDSSCSKHEVEINDLIREYQREKLRLNIKRARLR